MSSTSLLNALLEPKDEKTYPSNELDLSKEEKTWVDGKAERKKFIVKALYHVLYEAIEMEGGVETSVGSALGTVLAKILSGDPELLTREPNPIPPTTIPILRKALKAKLKETLDEVRQL